MLRQPIANQDVDQRVPTWKLVTPFLLIVFLQVVGSFFEGNQAWGFNLWAIWPWWGVWIAAIFFGFTSIPSVGAVAIWPFRKFGGFSGITAQILPNWIKWFLLCVIFAAIGWLLRSHAQIYGDGFTAVSQFERPFAHAFATVHDYVRPLNILVQVLFRMIFPVHLVSDPQTVFWFSSIAGGVMGLAAIVLIVNTLYESAIDRTIAFVLALSGSCTLLMLGWVEMYVWPTAALLWLLAVAIRYLKGRQAYWVVLLVAMVTIGFDALLLPAALTVAVASFKLASPDARISRFIPGPIWLFYLTGICAVALGVGLHFSYSFFFVPIMPVEGHPYWVLSLAHVSDVLNLVIFVAPVGLGVVVLSLLGGRMRERFINPPAVLFGLTAWSAFLVSFWIDPKLGAPRDWDLLSFYGFPLSLLAGYLLIGWLRTDRDRILALTQAIGVALILLIPNVYEKTNLTVALVRLEPLTWNDPHYQASYRKAYGCISWGAILYHQCGRSDLAEKCFRRRVAADPNCQYGWYNLGILAFDRQRYSQAVDYFGRAVQLDPKSEQYVRSLESAQVAAMRQMGR